MSERGIQLKIHLEEGRPEGLQEIQVPGWDIRGAVCSRARYPSASRSDVFAPPGVYLLEGDTNPPSAFPQLYVGKADNLSDRVSEQLHNFDFWRRTLVFSSAASPLTQTHVAYLESKLIRRGFDAKRAVMVNKVVPKLPPVSRADEDDAEIFLERILTVLPIVGLHAFELASNPWATSDFVSSPSVPLYYRERGSKAEGRSTDEGFLMLKGGVGRGALLPAAPSWIRDMREKLLAERILRRQGARLFLTRDYVFGSPSTAAAILVGGTVPGPIRWKTKEGTTLKDLEAESLGKSS